MFELTYSDYQFFPLLYIDSELKKFLNHDGRHYFDAKNIRAGLWKKVLKKSSVDFRTVYYTRHTFCSINLQNGEDVIWISKVLGHKNPRVTLEKYSKYIPSIGNKCTIFEKLN